MLGDGGITSRQCAITLNSESDKNYILFVTKLANTLFGQAPKSFKKKGDKAKVLYYNGSSLIQYFLSIGLKIGNKVKQQVDVPELGKKFKRI